jgi:hypothetical protein
MLIKVAGQDKGTVGTLVFPHRQVSHFLRGLSVGSSLSEAVVMRYNVLSDSCWQASAPVVFPEVFRFDYGAIPLVNVEVRPVRTPRHFLPQFRISN